MHIGKYSMSKSIENYHSSVLSILNS